MDRDEHEMNKSKKFSSLWNRFNIVSTFIKKLIFTNEINCLLTAAGPMHKQNRLVTGAFSPQGESMVISTQQHVLGICKLPK